MIVRLMWICLLGAVTAWEIDFAPSAQVLQTKKTGDNIIVSCYTTGYEGESHPTYKWTKDGADVPSKGVLRASGNRLYIFNSKKEDSGQYTCTITLDGNTQEQSINVQFYSAVKFVDAPAEQHPIVGDDAKIICKVDGEPRPQITWRRGGEELAAGIEPHIEFDEFGQVLILRKYDNARDDGTYTCEAMQPSSGTFETRFIEVTGYVLPVITIFANESITSLESDDVVLRCGGTGLPKPAYTWYRGGYTFPMPADTLVKASDKYVLDDQGLLTIRSVFPGDEGIYTCVASNDVGSDHKQTQLTVYTKPVISALSSKQADVGQTITIECKFTGDLNISAYWIFKGRTLDGTVASEDRFKAVRTNNSLALTITDVTVDDADEYICEASNAAGTDSASTHVHIKHAPVIVQHTDGVVRAYDGQRMTLMCEADAVPQPDWTWYGPAGQKISPDGSRYFDVAPVDKPGKTEMTILFSASASDYGTYSCEASNEISSRAGGAVARATVEVVRIVIPPKPDRLLFDGQHPTYAIAIVETYDRAALEFGQLPKELRFQFVTEEIFVEREMTGDFDWLDKNLITEVVVQFVDNNQYLVPRMQPESEYRIRVRGENEAGVSAWSFAEPYRTSKPTAPAKPQFQVADLLTDERGVVICNDYCTIQWAEPEAHGSQITGYYIEYASYEFDAAGGAGTPVGAWYRYPVEAFIPAHELSANMVAFDPDHYYVVRLFARNELGTSDYAQLVLRTPETMKTSKAGLSTGIVVLIIAIVLIFVFLMIDLLCYLMRECGLLWCLSASVFGARHGSQKMGGSTRNGGDTQVPMEEGNSSKKETIIADEHNERAPMM